MKDPFNFDKLKRDFQKSKVKILRDVTIESSNFFKVDVFDAQGFIDRSVSRWANRKPENDHKGRINVKTGRMQTGIRPRFGRTKGTVKTDAPYSGYVNDTRQFMGKSHVLDKKAEKIIFKALNKVFKSPPRVIFIKG